jgi:hypothetical protein
MQHDDAFIECLESIVNQPDAQVIAQHQGEFSQDFVFELASQIEEHLLEIGEAKSVVKKVFSALIEGLQNIRIHGLKKAGLKNLSFFICSKNAEDYVFFFSNLIDKKGEDFVQKAINGINKMSKEDLKAYYLQQLSNGKMTEKGGGGLGFITLGLKSDTPLEYNLIPIEEDLSLFTLRMTVRYKKD